MRLIRNKMVSIQHLLTYLLFHEHLLLLRDFIL